MTMKNSFFLFLTLSGWFLGFSQRAVDVKYDQDAQGNYTFSYNNKAFCDYILQVNFSTLQNAKSDHPLPFVTEVKPGPGKLFKLSKEKAADPIQLKYGFTSFKGCLNPIVDTGFVYVLPIAPGKETQAYEIKNTARSTPDGKLLKDWYAIRLRMKPGDTLYAARRGVVTDVNVSSGQNDAGVSGPDGDNYIEIVHRDCSFGEYGIVKKDGSFVKPGQVVEAGQPIGLVGGDKFGRGSEARFSVTYNQLRDNGQNNGSGEIYSVYVTLEFWTKHNGKGMLKHGGTYISEHPALLLTQEVSKPATKKKKAPVKGH
jgi:Peptidase family M23